MIIEEKIKVVVSGRNKNYYESKGYTLPYAKDKRGRLGIKKGSTILANVKDVHKNSQALVKYRCDDCGLVKEVEINSLLARTNSQYLKNGETVCSKCANKRMSGENNSNFIHGSKRYPEYRYSAKKRGIDFNISVNEFEYLIKQECHYCGDFSIKRNKKSRGNGIDRKNSAIGYTLSNCVPCCATCNFIKNNMGYADFVNYIKQVYKKVKNYEV